MKEMRDTSQSLDWDHCGDTKAPQGTAGTKYTTSIIGNFSPALRQRPHVGGRKQKFSDGCG